MSELAGRRGMVVIWMAVLMLTTACAGQWKTAPRTLGAPEWSIAVPEGWMHLSLPDAEMVSKNGPYLDFIMIQSRPLAKGFRFTKQELNPDMLPHEAAQVIIDNLRSDPHIRTFHLHASEPSMVGGRAGFKLTYSYRDQHDVVLKTIYHGVVLPDRFFNIRYTAAQRHYFENELPAFNSVLNSLRIDSH